jgi:hypothetical protein
MKENQYLLLDLYSGKESCYCKAIKINYMYTKLGMSCCIFFFENFGDFV